jgi:hypothetical protein
VRERLARVFKRRQYVCIVFRSNDNLETTRAMTIVVDMLRESSEDVSLG